MWHYTKKYVALWKMMRDTKINFYKVAAISIYELESRVRGVNAEENEIHSAG